jgi:hypothetical protein
VRNIPIPPRREVPFASK